MTISSGRVALGASVAVGIGTGGMSAALGAARAAPLLGWDATAIVFCAWVWSTVWAMDARATRLHALREDPGRALVDLTLLGAAFASLLAVGEVLFDAGHAEGAAKDVQAGLALASVLVSWTLLHTVFALRYARLYYTEPAGGVDFNEDDPPQYSDFAYLAFTLGMTFQVSDTDLTDRTVRRTALRHALLSFPLGTVIIAASINLVAGLAK